MKIDHLCIHFFAFQSLHFSHCISVTILWLPHFGHLSNHHELHGAIFLRTKGKKVTILDLTHLSTKIHLVQYSENRLIASRAGVRSVGGVCVPFRPRVTKSAMVLSFSGWFWSWGLARNIRLGFRMNVPRLWMERLLLVWLHGVTSVSPSAGFWPCHWKWAFTYHGT